MLEIVFKEGICDDILGLEGLYLDANWTTYTKDMECLVKAIKNSLKVITAWDKNKLVGLIRVVGDGYSIIYIQDLLVLSDYQGNEIGSKLLKNVLDEYKEVRQNVLLTDNQAKLINFYESMGFTLAKEYNCISFVKFGKNKD